MKIFQSQKILDLYQQRKRRLGDWLFSWFRRKKLFSKDFTVISNDCLAATGIYQKYGLKYNSPTIGLLFYPDDYIAFVENFVDNVKKPLEFKKTTKYDGTKLSCYLSELQEKNHYPIGFLEGDIEIHFAHYKSEIEARTKWNRRCQRINYDKLFFMFSDKDGATSEHLNRFANLPFKNKVFLSTKPTSFPEITVVIKEYYGATEIGKSIDNRVYEKYFDVTAWLNEKPFKKSL